MLKNIFLVFYILLLQNIEASHVREAFLTEDVYDFGMPQKKDGNLIYSINDDKFDEVFPVFNGKDVNLFSGQITDNKDLGYATGTLVNFFDTGDGKKRAFGITALHNFLSDNLTIPTRFSRKFYQGLMSEGSDTTGHVGYLKIEDIRVNKAFDKDFCVFTGIYMPNNNVFENDEMLEKFFKNIGYPKLGILEDYKEHSIYHYPLGSTKQRVNQGTLLKDGTKHKIRTCFASSGAAIFNTKKEIVGIHTGAKSSNISPNEFVSYEGKLGKATANTTTFNSFEFIGQNDIDSAFNGVSLYNLDEELNERLQEYSKNWKALGNIK